MLRTHSATLIAVLLLCAGTILHSTKGHYHDDISGNTFGVDDAFISYRYAQHLVDGNGLVFNPGDRVQGYSNLLYVVLIVPAAIFDRGLGVYFYSIGINLIFSAISVYVYWSILRRRFERSITTIGLLLFACNPAIWLWTGSGLETPLVVLLQLATCAMVLRLEEGSRPNDAVKLGTVLSLLILTRADGFVTSFIVAIFLLLKGRRNVLARAMALPGLTLVGYLCWGLFYYGDVLPNTYYAKVVGPLRFRIAQALRQMVGLSWMTNTHASTLYSFIAFLAPVVLFARARFNVFRWIQHLPFEAFFGASWFAYWLVIGGDWFGERFLLPLIPIGIMFSLRVISLFRSPLSVVVGVALLAVVQIVFPFLADPRFDYSRPKYDRWVVLGQMLGRNHPGKTVAVDAAGKVPFLSGLFAVDMLGLNDKYIAHTDPVTFTIAHSKFDPDYVLSRNPSFIAAWVENATSLDLSFGLSRSKYSSIGYTLRYLVSTDAPPAGECAIVDVVGWGEKETQDRIRLGYSYAVLEKSSRAIITVDSGPGCAEVP